MNREDKVLSNLMSKMSLNTRDLNGMIKSLEKNSTNKKIDSLIIGLGKMNVKISKSKLGKKQLLIGLKRQRVIRLKSIKGKKPTIHTEEEKNNMFSLMEKLKQNGGGKRKGFFHKNKVQPAKLSKFQQMKQRMIRDGVKIKEINMNHKKGTILNKETQKYLKNLKPIKFQKN